MHFHNLKMYFVALWKAYLMMCLDHAVIACCTIIRVWMVQFLIQSMALRSTFPMVCLHTNSKSIIIIYSLAYFLEFSRFGSYLLNGHNGWSNYFLVAIFHKIKGNFQGRFQQKCGLCMGGGEVGNGLSLSKLLENQQTVSKLLSFKEFLSNLVANFECS